MATTITATAMTDPLNPAALYRLLTFLSPGFPVGAFTYSHGLEQVVDEGNVTNPAELEAWLKDIICHGAGRTDAIFLSESCKAARIGDREALEDLRELALALQPSGERYLEASAQGTAFMRTVEKSWLPQDGETAELFKDLVSGDRDAWPYPVAVGLVCSTHDIPVRAAVVAYLQAFSANIVSAAIRTVPLGQNDGQMVLAKLEPVIFEITEDALSSGIDDLGSTTFLADIASMAHETQYSRLFRS
ncbi:urease accessory protein UreF [Roseibium sp. HPY-6]|uniref:urease accessory protein UreF n=1 Tax=Roseibium sp. HPY-6 TaxID=3229852 RepID=UPI00338E8BA3